MIEGLDLRGTGEPRWIRDTLIEYGFKITDSFAYRRREDRAYIGTVGGKLDWNITLYIETFDTETVQNKEDLIKHIRTIRERKLERILI